MAKSRIEYFRGNQNCHYGIWNNCKKEFQFGICEDSPMLAEARLFYLIGDNARKYRFVAKQIPKNLVETIKAQYRGSRY